MAGLLQNFRTTLIAGLLVPLSAISFVAKGVSNQIRNDGAAADALALRFVERIGTFDPLKAKDAADKAGWAEPRTIGSAVASDAFFPFADGLLAAVEAGATAVIQPGGSIRDEEVIAAADEAGLAMVFTGMRHFRH